MFDVDCRGILPYVQKGWTGVEIGVREGNSAEALLNHGVAFLYLIDPWDNYSGYPEEVHHECLRACLRRLWRYSDRFQIIPMKSENAAEFIPEVDFVWIDGNHTYDFVKQDCEIYWTKARHLLCGHDYQNSRDGMIEVKRAVDDFARENKLEVEEGGCWIIRKTAHMTTSRPMCRSSSSETLAD